MKKALYREWRPSRWDQVIGQDHIIHTLKNAVRSGRVAHAYLFAGPRGTGKTTTARLLAKAVNCLHDDLAERPCDTCDACQQVNQSRFLDLIEIDAASNTSVDDVRALREKMNFSPTSARYKVYIIDEVHMLSTAAFNALLKTLEEPPPHAIFVLATTEIHKIPATVLSRCQRYEFRRIPVLEMVQYLQEKCSSEKIAVEPDALTLIARQATGSMRDAISLLDQLSSTGEKVSLTYAQNVLGTATSQAIVDLLDALIQSKPAEGLNIIQRTLDAGSDPRQFARQVVDYCRNLMLIKMGKKDQLESSAEVRKQMEQQAESLPMVHLLEVIRLFNEAATDVRLGWQPGLQLELALAESIQGQSVDGAAAKPAAHPAPAEILAAPIGRQAPSPSTHHAALKPEPSTSPAATAASAKPETQPAAKPAAEKGQSAPAVPYADGSIGLKEVLANWKQVKETVRKQRPVTEGLLNSCQPLTMKGDTLVLAFTNEAIKDRMEKPENLGLAQSALTHVLGKEVKITCVLNRKAAGAPLDLEIEEDGMVRTALNLGGVIKKKE